MADSKESELDDDQWPDEDDFKIQLRDMRELVNKILRGLLDDREDIHPDLREAMRYTLDSPGKRVRSAVLLWCCELTGGRLNHNSHMAAAVIEMVHTYSLIHDDLPAMDNDDVRRGRPTCHKAYGEAAAILAGDALLTLAFETLVRKISDAETAVKLITELADAAGPAGMIAGQMADLQAEKKKGSEELLRYIHTNKTAKMFRCAAAMGAVCGNAPKSYYATLCNYGLKVGLGFQIADDILDVSAPSKHLGKTAGKDAKSGKLTYPSIMGMEKAREAAEKLAFEAVEMLEPFGKRADILRQLAMALLERTK